MTTTPRTLFQKVWDNHLVRPPADGLPGTLYIDLHLIHEVTTPQAFQELDRRGLPVRRPDRTLATMDHSTPTDPAIDRGEWRILDSQAADQLDHLEASCQKHGIPLLALGHRQRGIVHVIGPELGLTQPGMTIVCGDSHTSTHGAFGAFAFGIGTSEVGHVFATQCLLQQRPRTMEVRVDGALERGVTAKDVILAILQRLGIEGGTGHVLEYTGEVIRSLDMEGRMTVCNMSIEGGARAGMIAPDDVTFDYLEGRPYAPTGDAWTRARAEWSRLATDPGASYDATVEIDGNTIRPMITWGTNPGMSVAIDGRLPNENEIPDESRPDFHKALAYMGLAAGQRMLGHKIDAVFVGSCTNSRLSDLEGVARVLDGKRIAPGVRMLIVPGSQQIKRAAEERGLDEVFLAAGAEWREAGCSMCLAMNNDRLEPGETAVSTSNRNFEGRQGPGGRTLLASPLLAAAAAVKGEVTDVREIL